MDATAIRASTSRSPAGRTDGKSGTLAEGTDIYTMADAKTTKSTN